MLYKVSVFKIRQSDSSGLPYPTPSLSFFNSFILSFSRGSGYYQTGVVCALFVHCLCIVCAVTVLFMHNKCTVNAQTVHRQQYLDTASLEGLMLLRVIEGIEMDRQIMMNAIPDPQDLSFQQKVRLLNLLFAWHTFQ